MNASPWRAALASALPDFGLAAVYVLAWTMPNHIAPWVPRWAVLTMLLEFVVVHSTGFMGVIAFGRDQVREQVGMLLPRLRQRRDAGRDSPSAR